MSGAASLLAISQPAASRLAAELEEIADVKLYERHARGVMLTAYGRRMARRARTIFREIDEADREIAELKSGLIGRVRVGAVTGAAVEFVLPAIKHARVTNPRVDISVDVDTSDKLVEALDAGKLDFFLGRIPSSHDPHNYDTIPAGDEPVALVVRTGHPLTRQTTITLEDCVSYDWVMQPESALMRRTVETYITDRGVPLPGKVLSTTSQLLTLVAISETNAIAPLARSVQEFFSGQGGLGGRIERLEVADDLVITPFAITKIAGHQLSPASQMLHDLIGNRF